MTKKTKHDNLKKNFVWNMVGTILYAFTSLVFMIIATRINGVEEAGIFSFSFSFAVMLQVIGLYSGRTYQVTEQNSNNSLTDYFITKIICCIFMILAGISFCLIRNYEYSKWILISILLSYKCLDAFADYIYAIYIKKDNLYQCGISLSMKGLSSIIAFLIVDLITKDIIFASLGILISDVIILIFYDILILSRYDIKWTKPSLNNIRFLLRNGFSIFIFSILIQYVLNAQKYTIDFIGTNIEQTYFGIIVMPATFMAICAQFIINPYLYKINMAIKTQKYNKFYSYIRKIIVIIIIIGTITVILTYIIGIPILNLIYNLSLEEYLPHLILIIIGSIFFAIITALSNALIAIRKNIIQTIIYIFVTFITIFISNILFIKLNLFGASLSYLISMCILLILYILAYKILTTKFFQQNKGK